MRLKLSLFGAFRDLVSLSVRISSLKKHKKILQQHFNNNNSEKKKYQSIVVNLKIQKTLNMYLKYLYHKRPGALMGPAEAVASRTSGASRGRALVASEEHWGLTAVSMERARLRGVADMSLMAGEAWGDPTRT